MKQHSKILALAMGICLFEMSPSLAATTPASFEDSRVSLENAIQKINLQTVELQKEVKRLRAELQKMKQEKEVAAPQFVKHTANKQHQKSQRFVTVEHQAEGETPVYQATSHQITNTLANIPKLLSSPVVIATLPDPGTDLDPSGFISYQGGMSQGLFFLKQRQALEKILQGAPLPSATKPQVILSGKLEGQASWQSPDYGNDTTSLDLVTAELDVYAEVSPWVLGVMVIDYNNASLNQVLLGSGNPVNNSDFFLNRGYITIGNLSRSPIYFNMGQMYVPFGAYSSNMLSNPVTKVLGRTNTRAVELGYNKDKFNLSVYGFNGAANTGNDMMDNWGVNSAYSFNLGQYALSFGAGFINNITDSQGAQLTGGGMGTFQGFSQDPVTENVVHFVPGVDVNASLSRGPFYFLAEGIIATRAYDMADMTYNNEGAQPKAAHFEAGYVTKVFAKPTIFSVAYDQTWQGLAMGLPKNSYVATINTSIWKNTVEVLEFRHDMNYGLGDTATGACDFKDSLGNTFVICPAPVTSGGQQNTVLLQFGVYF